MLTKKDNIFVTGHKGLVGSTLIRRLVFFGYKNIITIPKNKLDLRDQKKVFNFFKKKKLMQSLMLLEKLVEFMQTINLKLILYMII